MKLGLKQLAKALVNLLILALMFLAVYKLSYVNLASIREFNEASQGLLTIQGQMHFKSMLISMVSIVFALTLLIAPKVMDKVLKKKDNQQN